MGQWTKARIQLCGRFVADVDGSRIEATLPGRLGRVLFAYLVLNRGRPLPRDRLLMAGWGEDAPAEARNALSVLLSKLRHGLGAEHLRGRTEIELLLPPTIFVDAEAALEGAHRAESSIAEGRWAQAWGPAGIAYHIATRPFLTGLEAPWIDEWRRRLEEVRLRGLECFAAAGLGLGGPALAQAEERARMLTELAPYRETGHRLLKTYPHMQMILSAIANLQVDPCDLHARSSSGARTENPAHEGPGGICQQYNAMPQPAASRREVHVTTREVGGIGRPDQAADGSSDLLPIA